jgi:hypothetical protein
VNIFTQTINTFAPGERNFDRGRDRGHVTHAKEFFMEKTRFEWRNKKFLVLLGTLIIGMAFSLVLAGCPMDDPPVEGGPSAGELAAQLAADINKISMGSATVNGATVTFSGKLSLESQFTVPAGVTLDLTEDGELALLDAALAVNGTVKAGSDKVRMESAASWGTINGSGTIQLKGKGNLLRVGRSDTVAAKTLTLDGVTLAGVADNNGALVGVNDGGAFVMKSGKITRNTNTGNTDTSDGFARRGGVFVGGEGATFTVEGGTIYGSADNLPTGVDPSLANTASNNNTAALSADGGTAKWGNGGTYTKGGVSQNSDSDIGSTDDTLIAVK